MKLTSESKLLIGILVATVALIGGASMLLTQPEKPPTPRERNELITQESHTTGNASSSAYLVEFSDFQCPACRAFEPTVRALTDKYKDKLLFAYRHFPLPIHEYSIDAARAAEAAGKQHKFWEASSILFENQDNFSKDFFSTQFPALVQLDPTKYAADVASEAVKATVDLDAAKARELNLPGTPTFFLNGLAIPHINTPEDLVKAVEQALQQ